MLSPGRRLTACRTWRSRSIPAGPGAGGRAPFDQTDHGGRLGSSTVQVAGRDDVESAENAWRVPERRERPQHRSQFAPTVRGDQRRRHLTGLSVTRGRARPPLERPSAYDRGGTLTLALELNVSRTGLVLVNLHTAPHAVLALSLQAGVRHVSSASRAHALLVRVSWRTLARQQRQADVYGQRTLLLHVAGAAAPGTTVRVVVVARVSGRTMTRQIEASSCPT